MDNNLKPCPFCGENAELRGGKGVASWIICNNKKCRATQGLELTGENAVKMWNTRSTEDAKDKEIEKLKSDLVIQKNLTNQACFESNRAYQETEKWKKMLYDLINKQSSVSTDPKVIVIGKDINVPTKESEGRE